MTKYAYIDFEYNHSKEQRLNLVAVCIYLSPPKKYYTLWLHNDDRIKEALKESLKKWRDEYIFVCFNGTAEGSSFVSLGLDPSRFKWIDIQVEWKMLTNHYHLYSHGQQLIDGQKRFTRPVNKYTMSEEEIKAADKSKTPTNLAGCAYKMLGIEIDTDHKNEMRDLIISAPPEFKESDRVKILEYCKSDVEHLPALLGAINKALNDSPAACEMSLDRQLTRGETSARTALMTCQGYPVSSGQVQKFADSVPSILADIAEDISRQFPEAGFFELNKKTGRYTMKQKPWRDWIESEGLLGGWLKTETGAASLSLDAWTKKFSFSHNFPEGNVAAQAIRYLKTKQNLNGFLPKPPGSKRKSFFDSLGSDGRARAWLNPYGSQSARFQPAATGFIPLKAAWMRALIQPLPGKSIGAIDYGSEEFLLAAILSNDSNMYESYRSGDPYLSFAKLAGAVPATATKKSHGKTRTKFKSTVLGVSYLMGHEALARKITNDTGEPTTPDEAAELIDMFYSVYSRYADWQIATYQMYLDRGYLALLDGWIMFGDNPNHRSVKNCPVQGAGSCILRKAIQLAQKEGLKVIIPLHDALYIEYDSGDLGAMDKLADCMRLAFTYFFKDDASRHKKAEAIRLDPNIWGPDCIDGEVETPEGTKVASQKIYIDGRAKAEYERFKQYF